MKQQFDPILDKVALAASIALAFPLATYLRVLCSVSVPSCFKYIPQTTVAPSLFHPSLVPERNGHMNEVKKCPICGGDMVHPVGVYIRIEHPEHGPTLYTITARGCDVSPVTHEAEHPRGVIIIREYLGECGHRWIETEQFHKGSTLQDWQQLNALVGPDYVIWRD